MRRAPFALTLGIACTVHACVPSDSSTEKPRGGVLVRIDPGTLPHTFHTRDGFDVTVESIMAGVGAGVSLPPSDLLATTAPQGDDACATHGEQQGLLIKFDRPQELTLRAVGTGHCVVSVQHKLAYSSLYVALRDNTFQLDKLDTYVDLGEGVTAADRTAYIAGARRFYDEQFDLPIEQPPRMHITGFATHNGADYYPELPPFTERVDFDFWLHTGDGALPLYNERTNASVAVEIPNNDHSEVSFAFDVETLFQPGELEPPTFRHFYRTFLTWRVINQTALNSTFDGSLRGAEGQHPGSILEFVEWQLRRAWRPR